ncbi:UDP-diphosphatase [Haloprofundus marisrubri]|uniref:Undecaprenyl-diphosphatase n=1 Tax=Haloprofundus marisrubri TaxID=1514971 RepID=A0A0W1R6C0_9EURY|nr:undecaprenyl-diphosphate phosphatase [Haloprofundus marisrubri]KTG08957.1 UDP-diphosphatase [Haloprofundus marisrubri]
MDRELLIALLAGFVQGIFEWLPISSEGNLALALSAVGSDPTQAVQFALFLHVGTAVSATVYYRDELAVTLSELPSWRPSSAFSETATLSFLAIATLASGIVGISTYLLLKDAITALTGGAFVALVGVLLIATGILQRAAGGFTLDTRDSPDLVDAVLVGGLQGLAILPGVSRSGVTASALLFRGHDGPDSFRLSFLLSIPAALGGGLLAALDGGLAGVTATEAAVALGTAAVVGYLSIDALMRVVRRVSFWAVCVGLGALALVGGLVVTL